MLLTLELEAKCSAGSSKVSKINHFPFEYWNHEYHISTYKK